MWGREVTTATAEPEPEPAEDDGGGDGGDHVAVVVTDDELFGRLYPALRRFAAVVAPPETDPDDLVQEAVGRALRRGPLTALDNPGGYLRRAIVNLAANERRRLGRWRRARHRVTPGEGALGESASYPSDVADLLRLPPATRAALWLVDVEGRSFDEVAELLGSTADALRARASRARRALRQTITEEER
jgi:DNA-directed RNA polymerase specialized sigma24 family protein